MKRKLSVLLSIFLCVALCISTLGLAADSTGDGEPAATDAPEAATTPPSAGPEEDIYARLAASGADAAIVFAGLPDTYESEGFDRDNMRLPDGKNRMIAALAAAKPNT